jgi:hypothetical protein
MTRGEHTLKVQEIDALKKEIAGLKAELHGTTNAELSRWANALKELGFTVHPGLSVPENLVNFAEWWKDRKVTQKSEGH